MQNDYIFLTMTLNFTGRYRQVENGWIGWVEGNPIVADCDALLGNQEIEYDGLSEISAEGMSVEEVQEKLKQKITATIL